METVQTALWIVVVLVALAIVGIADAQLRFVPVFKETRTRVLPGELEREFELSAAPPRPRAF